MAKRLVTEADVAARAGREPLVVDADTIVTPAALDLAHARGIPVVYAAPGGETGSGRESPEKSSLTPFPDGDGLYLVRIEGGRRTVIRLS